MFKFAVVPVSTEAYTDGRADVSGSVVSEALKLIGEIIEVAVVPNNIKMIEDTLVRLSADDDAAADAVFTIGGTGFAPDDVTPEATMAVVSRLAPGLPEAMRRHCMEKTNRAMLSRGVAGIRGKTLIINLPGCEKACAECIEVIKPVLEHALLTIRGKNEA